MCESNDIFDEDEDEYDDYDGPVIVESGEIITSVSADITYEF